MARSRANMDQPERSESLTSLSSDDEVEEVPAHVSVLVGDKFVPKRDVLLAEKRERMAKRQREEIAREEREFVEDNDFAPDAEDENTAKKTTARKKPAKKGDIEMTDRELLETFSKIGFQSPVYPDNDTLVSLGIEEDVHTILAECGLATFAETVHPAYPRPAAEFLATMKITTFADNKGLMSEFGGGLINFEFEGNPHVLNFNQINDVFGFAPGQPKALGVDKEDQNFVWRMLTGEKALPSQPNATSIRHPAINYARRIIAKTFYSRADPGKVNVTEIQHLAIAFKTMYHFKETSRGIKGDTNQSGLAFVLCAYLEKTKTTIAGIVKAGGKPNKFECGGIITGLLKKAGIAMDWKEERRVDPSFMDLAYLRTSK